MTGGWIQRFDPETLAPRGRVGGRGILSDATRRSNMGTVWDLRYLADGQRLLSLSANDTDRRQNDLVLWEVESMRPLARLELDPTVRSIVLSPDERHALINSSAGRVALVRLEPAPR